MQDEYVDIYSEHLAVNMSIGINQSMDDAIVQISNL